MSVLAVWLASLLGSVHCVAMCGGFATLAASTGRSRLAYQGGRLLGYLGLGAAAGLLGAGLDLAGGALLGLHRVAAVLTGSVLVAMAVGTLWPRRGRNAVEPLITLGTAPAHAGTARRWLLGSLRRGGTMGAAAVGLGSALLPCGWLWGYVLVAAATGKVSAAMAVMLAFWAGGLPALLLVGTAAGWLRKRVGPHAPRMVATLMLLLGMLALAGKLGPTLDPPAPTSATSPTSPVEPEPAPACHH